MHVDEVEGVELVAYQLKEVGEFMNLKQGKMSVQEYTLKFNQLARYAPGMTSSMKARMRKFASGLSDDLVLECQGAMLNKEVDFSRMKFTWNR